MAAPTGDRANLLAGIQKAGGIGALKKVDPSQVRDRSAALSPAPTDTGPAGSGLPPAGASSGGGSVMDSLAAALAQRKQKVSASGKHPDIQLCLKLLTPVQMTRRMMMTSGRVGGCLLALVQKLMLKAVGIKIDGPRETVKVKSRFQLRFNRRALNIIVFLTGSLNFRRYYITPILPGQCGISWKSIL
jgi:hypothetical protein